MFLKFIFHYIFILIKADNMEIFTQNEVRAVSIGVSDNREYDGRDEDEGEDAPLDGPDLLRRGDEGGAQDEDVAVHGHAQVQEVGADHQVEREVDGDAGILLIAQTENVGNYFESVVDQDLDQSGQRTFAKFYSARRRPIKAFTIKNLLCQ